MKKPALLSLLEALMAMTISFILAAAAKPILQIRFGHEYPALVFMILSFGFPFLVLYNVLTIFIAALERPEISMALGLALLPVDVFLIYQLIFAKGLIGVAVATMARRALGAITAGFYLMRRGCREPPKWKSVFSVGGASVVSY